MLGRNHAVYAAAAWLAAWPLATQAPGAPEGAESDFLLLGVSTLVAAGSGVIPDLDHPDSRAPRHFGVLGRFVSKQINSASGGHRYGTHSLFAAAILGALAWLAWQFPDDGGKMAAAIACACCSSVGMVLVGPSLGFKVPPLAAIAALIGPGYYAWDRFDDIAPFLWMFAAGGVIVHILCDGVTKGGVPFLWPFSRRRMCLGWFRVGGAGESVAGFIGVASLMGAGWFAVAPIF